jgi:hypothetical protein
MKIFVAEELEPHSKIELISGRVGLFQEPISDKIFTEVKSVESSDAILVPHDAYHFSKYPDYIKYLNSLAQSKLVIFSDRGDFPKKPKIINSIALRVAINPGESHFRKIVIPYNVESLAFLPFKKLEAKPSVSFVGFMPKVSLGRVKQTLLQSPLHPIKGNGAIVRRLTDNSLRNSNVIYKRIIRESYGALDNSQIDLRKNRTEYLDSIAQSDFVACPRGDANQSARFYETLSAGRIPIVPDTSIVFPNTQIELNPNTFINLPLWASSVDASISTYYAAIKSQSTYYRMQEELRQSYLVSYRFEPFVRNIFSLGISQFLNLTSIV